MVRVVTNNSFDKGLSCNFRHGEYVKHGEDMISMVRVFTNDFFAKSSMMSMVFANVICCQIKSMISMVEEFTQLFV